MSSTMAFQGVEVELPDGYEWSHAPEISFQEIERGDFLKVVHTRGDMTTVKFGVAGHKTLYDRPGAQYDTWYTEDSNDLVNSANKKAKIYLVAKPKPNPPPVIIGTHIVDVVTKSGSRYKYMTAMYYTNSYDDRIWYFGDAEDGSQAWVKPEAITSWKPGKVVAE